MHRHPVGRPISAFVFLRGLQSKSPPKANLTFPQGIFLDIGEKSFSCNCLEQTHCTVRAVGFGYNDNFDEENGPVNANNLTIQVRKPL